MQKRLEQPIDNDAPESEPAPLPPRNRRPRPYNAPRGGGTRGDNRNWGAGAGGAGGCRPGAPQGGAPGGEQGKLAQQHADQQGQDVDIDMQGHQTMYLFY